MRWLPSSEGTVPILAGFAGPIYFAGLNAVTLGWCSPQPTLQDPPRVSQAWSSQWQLES